MAPAFRRRLGRLVICVTLLTAPAGARGESPEDCSGVGRLDAQLRCGQGRGEPMPQTSWERACLDAFRGIVARAGDALSFKLDSGATKIVTGNRKACDAIPVGDCVIYDLVGFIRESRQFILLRSYYESSFVDLVGRKSGAVTNLEGYPHVSPNGKLFVSVAASDAWEIESPIAIYANSDPPALVWRFPEPQEYEQYAFDGWDGDDRVKLHTITNPKIQTDVRHTADGWVLRRPNGQVSVGTSFPPAPQSR